MPIIVAFHHSPKVLLLLRLTFDLLTTRVEN